MDGKAVSAAGVLINPQAGRGNGKGMALADALAKQSGVRLHVIMAFDELESTLASFSQSGVSDLFISSGDGTVQAVQTILAEKHIFTHLPRICLLPHGTTNMTASDIGYQTHSIAAQASFIADPVAQDVRKRRTLRVVNPRDGRPRHGMFLGTGAISAATRYTQVSLNDAGIKGNLATFATLASAVGKSLFSKANAFDPNRFDRPFPITVRVNGKIVATGTQLLALATTLEKLILGTRPFWGGKTGPIRVTTFPYPMPSLWRWFLPAILGGEARRPPPGATSVAVRACSIDTPVDYVIDGEFFDAPTNEALQIETGPEFSYIIR